MNCLKCKDPYHFIGHSTKNSNMQMWYCAKHGDGSMLVFTSIQNMGNYSNYLLLNHKVIKDGKKFVSVFLNSGTVIGSFENNEV